MDKGELKERIVEYLRSLDVGETVSVEDIAETIGEPLSDVNMAIDSMLTERLVFQGGMIGKRTYSLTSTGKHWKAPANEGAPKEQEPDLALSHKDKGYEELTKNEAECTCQYCQTVLASPGRKKNHEPVCGKNPDRNEGCGKKERKAVERATKMREAVARKYAGEPRPKDAAVLPADTPEMGDPKQCRWCKKVLCDKKYRIKHEDGCPKNPKNAKPKDLPAPNTVDNGPMTIVNGTLNLSPGGSMTPSWSAPVNAGPLLGTVSAPPVKADRLKEDRDKAPAPAEYADKEPEIELGEGRCHGCQWSHSEVVDDESGARAYDCTAGCHTNTECRDHRTPMPMATAAEVAEAESIRDELRKEITLRMHVMVDPAPGTLRLLKVLDAIEVIRRNTYDAPEIRANVRLGNGYDVEICLVEPKEATLCPQ